MSKETDRASSQLAAAVDRFESLQFQTEASQLSGYGLLTATINAFTDWLFSEQEPPVEVPRTTTDCEQRAGR